MTRLIFKTYLWALRLLLYVMHKKSLLAWIFGVGTVSKTVVTQHSVGPLRVLDMIFAQPTLYCCWGCCWGKALRMAWTSSATAIKQNSNCCRFCTIPPRWSRMCSKVAAMSISLQPFLDKEKSQISWTIHSAVRWEDFKWNCKASKWD